jgi:WD40 repeat protein
MKVKEDKIVMKPAAYEDNENPYYEMLDENPHFKNIYFSKLIGETFICIGMDRLISFWRVNKYRVQYDFNIKCLGSKANEVAVSPLEPQSFLLSCGDSTMRLWNTGKKANRFITTILWKGLDKKRIRKMVFHPREESIVALTSDKDLSLMDIHAHTLISEFKIAELYDGDIIFHQWLHRSIVEKLIDSKFEGEIKRLIKKNSGYKQFLQGNKYNNTKLTSKFVNLNPKYQKEVDPNYLYVTYVQNKGFIICDFKLGTVFSVNYNLDKFVSAVEIVDKKMEKDLIISFFGDKKGNLFLVRFLKNKYDHVFVNNVHNALISVISPIVKDQKPNCFRIATGSYDRTIKVLEIQDETSLNFTKKNVQELFLFKHKFRIMQIDWDPFDSERFLNTCQKHVTVQIWTLNPEKEFKDSEKKVDLNDKADSHYVANIRGHKGFITTSLWSRHEKDCVMTCSDDQSVKIWNLVNIKYRKPPSKSKTDSKLGDIIMEDDAEEEDFQEQEHRKDIDSDRYNNFTSGKKQDRNDIGFNTPQK